ncbi:uncharacterized protein LOC124195999 [Daphnia pulex]|uniref:uncharacterized protein LOC124195999 n=1 Tax=Daphnia pulex TaxID=6669 RepID=UPI001EDD1AEF|nr:uncharacterized protein LOC124195999 [Daphnia pulex]
MAVSSHYATTFFLIFVIALGVAGGQKNHLSAEDNKVLRNDYETLKDQFENFVKVQFGRLSEEVQQLKLKVQEQDLLLASCKSHFGREELDKQVVLNNGAKVGLETKSGLPRTCHEARLANPSLTSGVYWIDPDGQGVGEDPIQVTCDMSSGITFIGHNSESAINVGHCLDPGCYTRSIAYEASSRQISALIELSDECRQSIKYECFSAPLEFNEIAYSWWNDKNGQAQYYWSGNNNATHTCQCGIENSCVDSNVKCNCDSYAPSNLSDSGEITKKEDLPVSRLNFGRTSPEASSGIHTLGKLKCSGQRVVNGMPTSCTELWQIGHVLSGLYLIRGVSQVETVYCDFSKLPTSQGFQTWIGFTDVKSSPVFFYVQRNTDYLTANSVVPFEVTKLNLGNAMNTATGTFVAPRSGKYFFALSGISNSVDTYTYVRLQLNGEVVGTSLSTNLYLTFSLQSVLQLHTGDQIRLFLAAGTIHDNNQHFMNFVGFLIEESFF